NDPNTWAHYITVTSKRLSRLERRSHHAGPSVMVPWTSCTQCYNYIIQTRVFHENLTGAQENTISVPQRRPGVAALGRSVLRNKRVPVAVGISEKDIFH
ncbi:hypothetical protein J6590_028440, partial [Homalodisca vitripennis]